MFKHLSFLFVIGIIFVSGCQVVPQLTYNFKPETKITESPLTKKIVVMKSLDNRLHSGTTPVAKAFIPFYPFVKTIDEPETFVYRWNGSSFDYCMNFSQLVAKDLIASGITADAVVSPETTKINPLLTGNTKPDYIIRLTLNRMDWQADFTMYGLSILGILPQIFGAPYSYGFSHLDFKAEILNAQGKTIAERTFSGLESQDAWIYYYSAYLRALTYAYSNVSNEFRSFVAGSIQ